MSSQIDFRNLATQNDVYDTRERHGKAIQFHAQTLYDITRETEKQKEEREALEKDTQSAIDELQKQNEERFIFIEGLCDNLARDIKNLRATLSASSAASCCAHCVKVGEDAQLPAQSRGDQ